MIYNKDKILLTGTSCFIGFHLILKLLKKNYKVYSVISKPLNKYKGIQKTRIDLLKKKKIRFILLDLNDFTKVKKIITKIKPDTIIHLAANTSGLKINKFNLAKSISKNILYVENIFNSLDYMSKTNIIIASSNAEYKNIEGKVFENTSCQPPFNAYGLSKLGSTMRALQLSEQKKIKTVIIRIFNPIGSHDSEKKILSQVIKSIKLNKEIKLSPCIQKRDFIYIDRLVDGFTKTLVYFDKMQETSLIMNLCYGKPIKLKLILDQVCKLMGKNKKLLIYNYYKLRPEEPIINYGCNKKAIKLLNWNTGNIYKDITNWIKKEKKNEI